MGHFFAIEMNELAEVNLRYLCTLTCCVFGDLNESVKYTYFSKHDFFSSIDSLIMFVLG